MMLMRPIAMKTDSMMRAVTYPSETVCALSLHERVDDDRGCDVGGDQPNSRIAPSFRLVLESGPRDEAHVGPLGAEPVDEEEPGRDAGDERPDEEPAEDPPGPANVHADPPPVPDSHEGWSKPSGSFYARRCAAFPVRSALTLAAADSDVVSRRVSQRELTHPPRLILDRSHGQAVRQHARCQASLRLAR